MPTAGSHAHSAVNFANTQRETVLLARILRLIFSASIFVLCLVGGAHRFVPAPALGPFLDPANGVWALTRYAEHSANSTASIEGLGADVKIVYDDRAVPHIFATSEEDAYHALGWVVARDRLFQMFAQTMAASGRLSELGGASVLSLDREMRGLGLTRAAEQANAAADTASYMKYARAYAGGVNAYVHSMPAGELPLEFRLTGKQPLEWTTLHSFMLFLRMGYTLAYISTEGDRAAAATRVGAAAAEALFPEASPIQEPIQPNGQHAPRMDFRTLPPPGKSDPDANLLADATQAFMPSRRVAQNDVDDEPRTFASNNWAVSPRRSENGHALLEGDPHLDLTLPSIWYEVHLVVRGKLDIYGVTIPGAPGVIIGFNRDVAWTFTNTGTDVLDYYVETVDGSPPTRYKVDGQWRNVEHRVEEYRNQRGKVIATDTLYFTHRGPLRRVRDNWISMRWTVLEGGHELQAFGDASHARSVQELEDAMAKSFFTPAQNMLSADRGGHIAIRSTGHFPVRPGDGKGNVVRDGSASANDWTGYLPVDAYPQAFDPQQGYLASANQQPIDPRVAKGWWGGSYDPWRALRINALLRADSSVTTEEMRAMQTDPGSERANLFVPYLLEAARSRALQQNERQNTRLGEAAALLQAWDRKYTKQSTGATLFEEVMRTLPAAVWDELSADGGVRRVATPASAVLLELMSDSASIWWDDRATDAREHRDDIIARTILNAYNSLHSRLGPPSDERWRWNRVRQENIYHLMRLPALSSLKLPIQGGPGALNPSVGTGTHGSSWRMVVDLGPEIRAWGTYPGGQSGRPLSKRYRDHLQHWLEGDLDQLRFPKEASDLPATERSAVVTLTSRH